MNLFYTDPKNITASKLVLTGQEARHAARVLRYRVGDSIHVTDGCGGKYGGVIESTVGEELLISIREKEYTPEAVPRLTLAMGLIKKRDRLEFAVEKAVELGVRDIVVFNGEQSEKSGVRLERLQTTALSAMKQSLRVWLPGIHHCRSLTEVTEEFHAAAVIVADEKAVKSSHSINKGVEAETLLLVVGPEGGFSESEREFMSKVGADAVSLGDYRLRTETAVVALMGRFL